MVVPRYFALNRLGPPTNSTVVMLFGPILASLGLSEQKPTKTKHLQPEQKPLPKQEVAYFRSPPATAKPVWR
jgi:hypothetical protein